METPRDKRRQDELLRVAEQAAEWLIVLEEGQPEERAAFAAWLEESPLHVEMFLRATAVSRMDELVSPQDRERLAASAGADPLASNVVNLESPSPPIKNPARSGLRPRKSLRWIGGIAATVAAVSVGGWLFVSGPYSWSPYGTAVGEQRTVALDDGSMVYVNTDSRIEVRYSEGLREVRLVNGEALFSVARDTARPFRVRVGDAVVQAIGTQFNIYRRPSQTRVAVIEGMVQVSKDARAPLLAPAAKAPTNKAPAAQSTTPEKAADNAERLAAGQSVDLAADGHIARRAAVNVAQVTAWRQRRLVFEWETLGTIAEEFNRYNRSPQILVEGDTVRARRYTVVFDADNPQTLLKFLANDPNLGFAADGGNFVIRGR